MFSLCLHDSCQRYTNFTVLHSHKRSDDRHNAVQVCHAREPDVCVSNCRQDLAGQAAVHSSEHGSPVSVQWLAGGAVSAWNTVGSPPKVSQSLVIKPSIKFCLASSACMRTIDPGSLPAADPLHHQPAGWSQASLHSCMFGRLHLRFADCLVACCTWHPQGTCLQAALSVADVQCAVAGSPRHQLPLCAA